MKTIGKILLLMLVAALLCGCGKEAPVSGPVTIIGAQEEETPATEPTQTEPVATEPQYPYDYTMDTIFGVADCYKYVPYAKIYGVLENNTPFSIKAVDGYRVHQGGCTDGTYGYFLLADPNGQIDGKQEENCIMYKVDMATWEVLAISDPLRVQHGNSVTYNANIGKLVVAHCKPNANQVSIVDPEKMVVEQVITLERNITSMTYNASRDLYVGRDGDEMFVFDGNFKLVDHFLGANDLLGIQNILCDDNYIYMLNSGVIAMPGTEGITVYDWNGGFRGVFRVGSMQETETLLIYDGKFYVSFYTGNGGKVYQLDLDLELMKY